MTHPVAPIEVIEGVSLKPILEQDRFELSELSRANDTRRYSGTKSHVPVVDARFHSPQASTTSNSLSSPILSLLEELLVMILDDVIASESSYYPSWWLSSPRNLASVCKAWRTIVFACPRLWRHVHLTPRQSIHALEEHLWCSSPLPIHLTVHQWPFRNPIPHSIVALTAQLQSILLPLDRQGTTLAPVSQRVASITIHATESSTFPNFVLQTWSGRGSKFPALRQITMNGNTYATWSTVCFFDGRHAPNLARLELNNVVIAQNGYRFSWGVGSHLTTLVWRAPVGKQGSLIVSVMCFHHVVSSFPNLVTLVLQEHVVGLEFATLGTLEESGVAPLTHIRRLELYGMVFPNARAAHVLFYLLPSVRHVSVHGRACSGPLAQRTVTLALQGMVYMPMVLDWPVVFPSLESLAVACVEEDAAACAGWTRWCMGELVQWQAWREHMASEGKVMGTRVHIQMDGVAMDHVH